MTSERYAFTRAFHGTVNGREPQMVDELRPPGVIADFLGSHGRAAGLGVIE